MATVTIRNRRRKRLSPEVKQRAQRLAATAAAMADDVAADKAERAKRMAQRSGKQTATIDKQPEASPKVQERRSAAALAELQRNGIEVSKAELLRHKELQRLSRNAIFEAFEGQSFVREMIAESAEKNPETFEGWNSDEFCELTSRIVWLASEPVKPAVKEFHSKPDAKAIPREEICNFEALTEWDRMEIDKAVEDAQWGGWPEGDRRWTLTPAEWRKAKRAMLTNRKLVAKGN